MSSPPVVRGWGLVHLMLEGKRECIVVKDTIADIRVPDKGVYKVVPCPCGVHGCCGGKMPCLTEGK